MNLLKKITAVSLSAAILIGAAGCNSADTSWAAEYDGIKIPAGVYISIIMDSHALAKSKAPEGTKDVLKTQIDGVDASAWILADAKAALNEYIAVEQKFTEMGLSLTDNDKLQVQDSIETQWQYLEKLYTENGVAKSSLQMLIENSAKSNAVFFAMYDKGGEKEVAEDEIKKSYTDNYAVINYIASKKTDDLGQPFAAEDLAKSKERLQNYFERAEKGQSFNALIMEHEKFLNPNEPSTHEHADENAHDTIVSKTSTSFPTKFVEEIFKAEVNKPVLVEDEAYDFVAIKKDPFANAKFYENYRSSVLYSLKSEEFQATVTEWGKAVVPAYNEASMKLYVPSRIK